MPDRRAGELTAGDDGLGLRRIGRQRRLNAARRGRRLLVAGVGHLLTGRRHREAGYIPGAVGDQGEGAAAGDGAALVGDRPAQREGGLQLGACPVELSAAEGEHAQLVVEVGAVGGLPGEPGGLGTLVQGVLPGAPVQARGEGGRGGAGEPDGDGLLVLLGPGGRGDRHGEGGEYGVGLRAHPLGRDRGVPGPPGVVLGGGAGAGLDVVGVSGGLQLGPTPAASR